MAVLLAGCGTAPNPPSAIVQNYLNVLGGGEYATACGMADSHALEALLRSKHARLSCAKLFRRCLPNRSIVLKSDQTQLLYANINVSLSDNGKIANADTSATPRAVSVCTNDVATSRESGDVASVTAVFLRDFARFGRYG